MKNPIQENTGSAVFFKAPVLFFLLFGIAIFAIVIAKGGFLISLALIALPVMLIFLNRLFSEPKFGIYSILFAGFLISAFIRYIGDYPFGLSIDILLVTTYIAFFFKNFYSKMDWKPATNDLTLVVFIWFFYTLLQLLNPEGHSKAAWFFAVRGISLYMFLMVPLVMLLMSNYQSLNKFLYIWAVFSIIATLKGAIQLNIGLDPWEQQWMDAGGRITHLLFGKLRVFSFYSDAGQFGAAQAHAGLVGTIIFLNSKNLKDRILFGTMAVMGFYGMIISGTRGTIAVPFAGFFLYLILTRNVKMITVGTIIGITIFIFFKFTTIGNSVYAINRMRTAFNPNDPSLLVRLESQKILRIYLADKPLGGGIGSAGNWGKRFSPEAFLANVETDSWYVMIWAEQGVVGLALHFLVLFYILGRGIYISMFRVKDSFLQAKLFALASGILGIMAASYGNSVIGQVPTAPIIYSSMAFLFLGKIIDKKLQKEELNDEKSNIEQIEL